MKTKFIGILMLCVFVSQIFTSCSKQFLTKNPLDALSSETFWKSDADVQMALTGVYSKLQTGFYSQHKVWLDAYSDNALDAYSYFGLDVLTQGIVNPTNVNGTFYYTPYQGIASCNYFLDNVGNAPIPDSSKNSYSAEVRFLRAMYYFDLVQAFGGVVVYKSTPASVPAAKIAKTSSDSVLAFINEDLDFAAANLPNTPYNGHAVKASALAEEARVALFQKNWSKAADLTSQIMNSGIFSIYRDYRGLFLTATQQGNPEIIFSTKYLAPNDYQGDYAGFDIELGWFIALPPYKSLVNEYEMSNGKLISDPLSGFDASKPYANRDPRLKLTIMVPGDPYLNPDGSVFESAEQSFTGFGVKKYVDLSKVPFSYAIANTTDQNVVHTRYADVLLMYAEAENELSGPDATIYSALNQIRSRAGIDMPAVDQATYGSQSALRDFIRHERRVELALEGFRYYDLKRWGLMQDKLSVVQNPGGVQLKFGEINNVLPFPQAEIDANPQLKQNPGYPQ